MGPLSTAPVDAQGRVRGRTLAVVGGGLEALPGIKRARELGLRVVLTDGSADCPGRDEADVFLQVSTYDAVGTVDALRESGESVHGAICIATDVPLTVAMIADHWGLPGLSVRSAVLASDKLEMKRRLRDHGVPIPWFDVVSSVSALSEARESASSPLILKPVDSRGSRGVVRLLAGVDSEWAFMEAMRYSPTGRVMVESFLHGPQISTESLVVDGVVHTVGLADRNYEKLERFAPFVVEDGGELPADLDQATQAAIHSLIERSAHAMGIRDGVIKGDIVIHNDIPHVIEVAARLSGGYFCTHEIPLSTGVDLVGAAIMVALGERPDLGSLAATRSVHVAQRYLLPKPGRVKSISGVAEVAARSGVKLCEVRVRVGDLITSIDNHPARAGLVIATGDSRLEARTRAQEAIQSIRIEAEPDPVL